MVGILKERNGYFVYDSYSKEDFKKVSQEYSNNFYAQLAYKLRVLWDIVRKDSKNRGTDTNLEPFDLMGNKVRVLYKNDKLYVIINGYEVYSGEVGAKTVERALSGLVNAEVKGLIQIDRPKGRSLYSDAKDLDSERLKKKGFDFPKSVFKAMRTTPEGKSQSMAKMNRKNKKVLSIDEFNYLVGNEGLDVDNYYKEGNEYIRNDIHRFNLEAPKGLKYRIKNINEINEDLMESNLAYKEYFERASKSLGEWYVTYRGNDYKIYGNHLEKSKL